MTAAALPAGLVSHTDNVSSELGRFDTVDVEVVAKLWRVYATNKGTLDKSAGARLENLLWRIWGSSPLRSSIDGAKLARLFLRISDDHGTQNVPPNSAGSAQVSPSSQKDSSNLSSPQASQKQHHPQRQKSHGKKKGLLPPPILKKSRAASDEQSKNEQVLFLDVNYNQDATMKSSASSGAALPSQPDLGQRGGIKTLSPLRKRTTFTTSLAALEESPLSRRSSAESTPRQSHPEQSFTRSGIPHDLNPPQNTAEKCTQKGSQNRCISREDDANTPRSQDNVSRSNSPVKNPSNSPPPTVQALQTPSLVEKDFRTKFVEKQHQQRRVSTSSTSTSDPAPLSTDSNSILNPNEDTLSSISSQHHHHPASSPIPVDPVQTQQQPRSSFSTSKQSGTSNPRPSTSLSRSSSARMPSPSSASTASTSSRGPAQSQLSKLLERNRETSSQRE